MVCRIFSTEKQVDITGGLYRDNNQYLLSKDLCPNLFEVLSNKLILWSLETLQPDRHNGEDAMLQQCKFSLWTPAWDDDDEEHEDGGGGGGSGVSVKNCHGPPKVMTRNSPPKPVFSEGPSEEEKIIWPLLHRSEQLLTRMSTP